MAVVQSQYTNANNEIHLRDYRHARNLYYEYGMAFAPKTKYLYHCLFEPSPEIGNSATKNSFAFQKHLGVLVKTADLPSFRIDIDNKKQYNRVKQFQTRIDYNDVNISFHDDNLGVTRAMLEEYYKYYFVDGSHNIQKNAVISGPYASRDAYSATVPKYGLNNGTIGPFFSSITIYQLSRQEYFAYTLVNPLVTQWNHGSVDASDASGMNEHTMSIAYEAVMYTNGKIGNDSQPVAFGESDTGYDQTPSILSEPSSSISSGPKLLDPVQPADPPVATNTSLNDQTRTTPQYNTDPEFKKQGNVDVVPKQDTQNVSPPVQNTEPKTNKKYTGAVIGNQLGSPPNGNYPLKGSARSRARNSFAAKAINSGAVPGVSSMAEFKKEYSKEEQNQIIYDLADKAAAGDQKLTNFANEAIGQYT
jgi:hypothetical protein